jgi:RNA polymerase sigma factor (sigma-70 family)
LVSFLRRHEAVIVYSNLNEIVTNWEELLAAHAGEGSQRTQLQARVCQRYFGAVLAYLNAAVRNSHVADDLAQEFAYRLVRGDFRHLNPSKGRFRDYIKGVLSNLIADYYRRERVKSNAGELDELVDPDDTPPLALEKLFVEHWRQDVLRRTWERFNIVSSQRDTPYFEVLQCYAQNTQLTSVELAERLSALRKTPISATATRQILSRARQMFASCLREEIGESLMNSSPASIDEELCDLGLAKYIAPNT